MPRDGDQRFERRYRRPRARRVRPRALDVERGCKAHAMPRGDEAQRLVLRRRDRTDRLELAQSADQREVVRRDVRQDEQPDGACTVFGCDPVVGGGRRAGAKPTGHIDLPRHTEPGRAALERGATIRIVVDPGDRGTEVRQQRGTPDRLAGSRGAHALGRDLHIAVFASRALDEIGQHGVAEAFPPRDLRGSLGLRGGCELARHVDFGLQDRRRTSAHEHDESRQDRRYGAREYGKSWHSNARLL